MADYTIQINAKDNTKQTLQKVDKGLDKATKRALMFKGALGLAGVALAGLGAVTGIRKVIDDMDNLAKRARTVGATTEESFAKFQIIDDFLQQAGLSAEETDRALVNLTTRLTKGANGNKAYAETMAKLGDSIFDTNGKLLDTPDLFVAVAAAIQNGTIDIEDAQKILGERVGPKIFETFKQLKDDGIGVAEALSEVAQSTPIVSLETAQQAERFNDILTQLGNILQKLLIESLEPLMPVLVDFAERLLANMPGYIESVKAAFEALQPVFDLFSTAVTILEPIFAMLMDAFLFGVEKINGFVESLGGAEAIASQFSATIKTMAEEVSYWIGWMYDNSIGKITELTEGIGDKFWELYDYVVGGSVVPDMVDGIIDEWTRLEKTTISKTNNIVSQTKNDYDDLAKSVGINNKEIADSTALTVESIEQDFANTLANALSDGKLSLDDFRGFFQQTMTAILTDAMNGGKGLSNIFGSIFGGGGAGGGLGGIFSGLFGGGGGGLFSGIGSLFSGGGLFSGIGNFFGGFFADGGHLGAGKFGIAGENGPELISGPAQVTPMSGMGQTVVFNINAIDTQTGTQFLLDNKQQIVGMIQQAGHRRGKEIF